MLGLPARVSQLSAQRVQGFDSFEHKALGDAGGGGEMVTLDCGIKLTYGEVVALSGDFYGSPEKLMKAPPEEVQHLRELIRQQGKQAADNPDGKPSKEQGEKNEVAFQHETKDREKEVFDDHGDVVGKKGSMNGGEDKSYASLAKENQDHFSPNNMEVQYGPQHEKAIALAAQARDAKGEEKAKLLNEAHLYDGFASHFLTDAFASGHLVSGEFGRRIGEEFYKMHQEPIFEALSSAAAEDLQADRADVAGEVMGIMDLVKTQCGSLCLKLVHDMLNEQGLEVQNKRGDVWFTKGDDNLAKAPKTQQLAAEAVRVSREEVDFAAKTGQSPEPKAMKLVPDLIGHKGQVYPLREFTKNPLIFERYLRPLLLDKSKANPLYQLVKGNLRFGKEAAAEWVDQQAQRVGANEVAGRVAIDRAVGKGLNAVGHGLKSVARGVADFVKGDEKVAGEQAEMDHELIDKGFVPSHKARR